METPDMINLIRKIAWKVHTRNPSLDWDELVSEGCVEYLSCMRSYDPKKGAISTYVYHCVRNRLLSYSNKQKDLLDHPPLEKYVDNHESGDNPEAQTIFKDLINNLSKEAQFVCKMIFWMPATLAIPPKLARGKIRRRLENMGWKRSTIQRTFLEIKNSLTETY